MVVPQCKSSTASKRLGTVGSVRTAYSSVGSYFSITADRLQTVVASLHTALDVNTFWVYSTTTTHLCPVIVNLWATKHFGYY